MILNREVSFNRALSFDYVNDTYTVASFEVLDPFDFELYVKIIAFNVSGILSIENPLELSDSRVNFTGCVLLQQKFVVGGSVEEKPEPHLEYCSADNMYYGRWIGKYFAPYHCKLEFEFSTAQLQNYLESKGRPLWLRVYGDSVTRNMITNFKLISKLMGKDYKLEKYIEGGARIQAAEFALRNMKTSKIELIISVHIWFASSNIPDLKVLNHKSAQLLDASGNNTKDVLDLMRDYNFTPNVTAISLGSHAPSFGPHQLQIWLEKQKESLDYPIMLDLTSAADALRIPDKWATQFSIRNNRRIMAKNIAAQVTLNVEKACIFDLFSFTVNGLDVIYADAVHYDRDVYGESILNGWLLQLVRCLEFRDHF